METYEKFLIEYIHQDSFFDSAPTAQSVAERLGISTMYANAALDELKDKGFMEGLDSSHKPLQVTRFGYVYAAQLMAVIVRRSFVVAV